MEKAVPCLPSFISYLKKWALNALIEANNKRWKKHTYISLVLG